MSTYKVCYNGSVYLYDICKWDVLAKVWYTPAIRQVFQHCCLTSTLNFNINIFAQFVKIYKYCFNRINHNRAILTSFQHSAKMSMLTSNSKVVLQYGLSNHLCVSALIGPVQAIEKYSGDLNRKLYRYLSGPKLLNWQMISYSYMLTLYFGWSVYQG